MYRVDLNADVGERSGDDAALMRVITSANVACGFHAGDPATMRQTVELAKRHGVAVGAHPGFDDAEHFGRLEVPMTPGEVEALVAYQLGALKAIARLHGVRLRHVKPHGALYNMAARDAAIAEAIARAVAGVDPSLVLFGLSGSALVGAGRRAGLTTASEVFADRAYRPDGSLVPRGMPGAVIEDADLVVPRAVQMVRDRTVTAIDGTCIRLDVDTMCLHSDTPAAAVLAARIRDALIEAGVVLAAVGG